MRSGAPSSQQRAAAAQENPPDPLNYGERFTLLLERDDEILRASGDVHLSADASLSDALRQRLQRGLACLRRMRGFAPAYGPRRL